MLAKTALLSVFHKEGIVDFAGALVMRGWEILASGGTAKTLKGAGIPVRDVGEIVGEPILGHRVVTLSREIHAGLMARNLPEDEEELNRLGLPRIGLVCVDLYPLAAAIAAEGSTRESVIEMTDVGGPTMLHSGAKGERIVVCDPSDRMRIIDWLDAGLPDEQAFIDYLAAKADAVVGEYCLTSSRFRGNGCFDGFVGERGQKLCYGENRRQGHAAFMKTPGSKEDPLALNRFERIEGNDPSYINMTDLHRLVETATRLGAGWETNFGKVPLIGIAVKHGNACGAAVDDDPYEIIVKMVKGDPEAISGGLVLLSFRVDGGAARLLRGYLMPENERRVLDSVIAPDFTDDAIQELSRKTGKCRLFVNRSLENELGRPNLDTSRRFRQVRGGFLVQDGDPFVLKLKDEWKNILTVQQQQDLVLGWAIGCTSNSNTITLTKNKRLLGSGINQRSRVMAAKVALLYASTYGHDTHEAVAYSDSFFPFPDGPMVLADAGIRIIFATSGSIRDEEVAKACEERGVRLLTIPDAEARGFYGH